MTRLTKHFTLEEFTCSATASARGIDNTPPEPIIRNLTRLAQFNEEVRAVLGGVPMAISSGYRCEQLNKAVGGSKNSAHLDGLANDFTAPAFGTPLEVCQALDKSPLDFDQLIYEHSAAAVWVHLGIAKEGTKPRRQVLTIDHNGTRYGL